MTIALQMIFTLQTPVENKIAIIFRGEIFIFILFKEISCILIQISVQFVIPRGLINNKTQLVNIKPWQIIRANHHLNQ